MTNANAPDAIIPMDPDAYPEGGLRPSMNDAPDAIIPMDPDGAWENNVRDLLRLVGEDPTREGLLETPRRVRDAWREWCQGYSVDVGSLIKTFSVESDGTELVSVLGIPVYSQCEHHLVPFFGSAHVGYLPRQRVIGLSKVARIVHVFSARLQIQERLTSQIADAIWEHLGADGVAVVLQCRHLCMEARGARTPGTQTTTYAFRGSLSDPGAPTRTEFLASLREAR